MIFSCFAHLSFANWCGTALTAPYYSLSDALANQRTFKLSTVGRLPKEAVVQDYLKLKEQGLVVGLNLELDRFGAFEAYISDLADGSIHLVRLAQNKPLLVESFLTLRRAPFLKYELTQHSSHLLVNIKSMGTIPAYAQKQMAPDFGHHPKITGVNLVPDHGDYLVYVRSDQKISQDYELRISAKNRALTSRLFWLMSNPHVRFSMGFPGVNRELAIKTIGETPKVKPLYPEETFSLGESGKIVGINLEKDMAGTFGVYVQNQENGRTVEARFAANDSFTLRALLALVATPELKFTADPVRPGVPFKVKTIGRALSTREPQQLPLFDLDLSRGRIVGLDLSIDRKGFYRVFVDSKKTGLTELWMPVTSGDFEHQLVLDLLIE